MADEPNDKASSANDQLRGAKDQPPDRLPLDPLGSAELLRQDAELAAAMQAKLEQACQRVPAAPSSDNKLGARKDARFKAICTAPSINWTPAGAGQVPVPYQTVQDLSNSMSTARTVRFNGSPAYLLDQTSQPKGTGDERGTGKGIRSGTVTGEVKPVSGSKSVRIEGNRVVREGDRCTMNGGNNPGIYVALPDYQAKLPITQVLTAFKVQLEEAIRHPFEATKGILKSIANTPSEIIELLARASLNARADDLKNSSLFLESIGQRNAAALTQDVAKRYQPIADNMIMPKLRFSNAAQKGGEQIGLLAQVFSGGTGLVRATSKVRTVVAKQASSDYQVASGGFRIIGNSNRVATKPNEAFFWSGRTNGIGGQDVAAELAMKRGGTTLEMLIESNKIRMPAWNPDDPVAIKAWEDISTEFASGASGRVRAVIGASLRPGNIWETKELPRLKSNPNVTEIITIDPVTNIEKTVFKR